ncbi:hypothetical protein AMJ86_06030 [bacterium SM23_57]|nr:MAG: hypothetical protein AMJ86_06030 [bacterium SM23_57]
MLQGVRTLQNKERLIVLAPEFIRVIVGTKLLLIVSTISKACEDKYLVLQGVRTLQISRKNDRQTWL